MRMLAAVVILVAIGCVDDPPDPACAAMDQPATCPDGFSVNDYGAGIYTCVRGGSTLTWLTCDLAPCDGTYETDGKTVACVAH